MLCVLAQLHEGMEERAEGSASSHLPLGLYTAEDCAAPEQQRIRDTHRECGTSAHKGATTQRTPCQLRFRCIEWVPGFGARRRLRASSAQLYLNSRLAILAQRSSRLHLRPTARWNGSAAHSALTVRRGENSLAQLDVCTTWPLSRM